MWFLLWVLIAAFILGVFFWSTAILFQQKRAWEAFAKKHGMTYAPGKFLGSPSLSGVINGYRFSFFTDAQKTSDARGQRFVTVIEGEMGGGMPVAGAISTKEFKGVVDQLGLNETLSPAESSEWSPDYVVGTRDEKKLRPYLTPARAKILHGLFSMKNAIALFMFHEQESVVRIETTDPMRDAVHMEKIIKRLTDTLNKLKPTEEEKTAWHKADQAT